MSRKTVMGKTLAVLSAVACAASLRGASLDTSAFGKMIPLTISGYAGSSTLEHFPVLVRLSTAITGFDYADVGATAAEAAADLRFADAAGDSLDYEIDTWDAAGTSLVWVSVPAISGKATRIFAYYKADGSATLPAVDSAAVWSSAGYVGVWHMNAVDATDYSVADSSGNNFKATPKASSANPTLVTDGAGPFGNYIKGASGGGLFLPVRALVPYNADASDKMQDHYSAEIWLNRNGDSSNKIVLSTGEGWNTGAQVGLQGYLYGNAHHNSNNNKIPVTAGVWSLVAATWTTADNGYLFCGSASLNDGNGLFLLENLTRTDTNSDFTQFSLNSYANRNSNGSESFPGYMDEIRLRRVASTKDWAQAVYDNGKSGSTFLAAEAVVSLDAGVTAQDGVASGVAYTGATITGLFAAANPTDYTATYTLSAGGTAICTDVPAGALASDGSATVVLDDLVPDTAYTFIFAVVDGDATVYSAGSFTTAALPVPTVSGIGDNTATATFAAPLPGASYAAGTVTAVFEPVGSGTTVSLAATFADGAWTATATTLEADQDYVVRFVVAPAGAASLASPDSAAFATTGRATVATSAFRYGMKITAAGYDGDEALENFPALVRVSSTVAAKVEDPSSIRFALADGTLLAHDIEYWNPDGESSIWVSIPSLSGKETSFLMLWDPSDGATVHGAFAPFRVWQGAGYVGVWHFAAQNADGSYPDASGHGATAVPVSSDVPAAPVTDGTAANGSPWHVVNTGVKVAPENTADWTFSTTGYTTETWLIPSASGNYAFNRMFLYDNSNNNGNAMAYGEIKVYMMNGPQNYDEAGNWTSGKSAWRFATAVWKYSGADWDSRFYENATQKKLWTGKNAVNFTVNGMGLTTGIGGNGILNYSVDEIRVRRGNSTAAWVQANYDTQVPGTDFLVYADPMRMQKGLTVLIR